MQLASSTSLLQGGRGSVIPSVCSLKLGTRLSTALLGRQKAQISLDTLRNGDQSTAWVSLPNQGTSHMWLRFVVSRHMLEEVGQQMQVAQPVTPATTPIPTHPPSTHTREWTQDTHTMDPGGRAGGWGTYDALATRRTERGKGQVEGCFVPREGSDYGVPKCNPWKPPPPPGGQNL